ncbi:lipoprotein LpqV [[Mycobacterium] burgundiense]|jgi:hypothetical protein|uniref:Lipoprotein LpqV n=1 Tax=[Mycobacterium] burgundiense TaxID=3064286 RepID=A0ABM9LEN4_9MYCO|nr:lipoprotein LpqV [Mycolicibacterium sp. MU0053]CAJ1497748.1 lipoprotein LpqV [Mycolicibacterium sp. MU0053]
MRRYPNVNPWGGAVLALVAATLGAGCSSGQDEAAESAAPAPSTSTSEMPAPPAEPVPAGAVGVSPGGITTRVDVPSVATESQYGQACLAAKRWIDAQGGDPKVQVEPYLKVLQEPGFSDPGNFHTPWSELTPAQQAGVILAVNAAADGQCG